MKNDNSIENFLLQRDGEQNQTGVDLELGYESFMLTPWNKCKVTNDRDAFQETP